MKLFLRLRFPLKYQKYFDSDIKIRLELKLGVLCRFLLMSFWEFSKGNSSVLGAQKSEKVQSKTPLNKNSIRFPEKKSRIKSNNNSHKYINDNKEILLKLNWNLFAIISLFAASFPFLYHFPIKKKLNRRTINFLFEIVFSTSFIFFLYGGWLYTYRILFSYFFSVQEE